MYAEIIVNLRIIKRSRRDFVDIPDDADSPATEMDTETEGAEPSDVSPDDNPFALTFHYHIPPHLEGLLQAGHLVAVPFRTRQLMGVVVALSDVSPVENTRPVAALLDAEPVLTPAQIQLAYWLSREQLAPLATCIRYFLPPGSGRKP